MGCHHTKFIPITFFCLCQCLLSEESHISWLTKWSGIFESDAKYYSMPEYTQKEIINLNPHEGEKLYAGLNQRNTLEIKAPVQTQAGDGSTL